MLCFRDDCSRGEGTPSVIETFKVEGVHLNGLLTFIA